VPKLFDIDVRCNQGPILRQLVGANIRRISIGMEIGPWDLPRQIPRLSEELRKNQNETPEEGNELLTPFRLYLLRGDPSVYIVYEMVLSFRLS
jgi:hypothetical protein